MGPGSQKTKARPIGLSIYGAVRPMYVLRVMSLKIFIVIVEVYIFPISQAQINT